MRIVATGWSVVVLVAGCGGTVVFEENGGAGGDGGSSGNVAGPSSTSSTPSTGVSSAGDGGADVTSTSVTTIAASSSVTSASTGVPAACLGLVCGEDCVQCNEFECVNGFCDELGACIPERVCDPPTHTLCYRLGKKETCADIDSAPFRLCTDCSSGKGCTFFGEVFSGPTFDGDECCYVVNGDCAPNP